MCLAALSFVDPKAVRVVCASLTGLVSVDCEHYRLLSTCPQIDGHVFLSEQEDTYQLFSTSSEEIE